MCGAYRGTGAQQTIKAPSPCRIGAAVGPVAGLLVLGLILGRCPGGGRGAPLAGSWPKHARSRRHGPRIRVQGGPSGKVKGWRRWPGSWPGPAAWIRTGDFDRGKRGTGAEARPSRAHRPRAAPRCAGRTGALPGHRGATEDQGPVLLPDRGSRGPLGGSLILGQRPGGGVVPRWPDHGRRTPGAAATAPDRDTGRAVRQGEGGGAVFGAMPLQRVRPHRGIVSFWPHVQP